MAYIGNPIYQSAFVTDQFSGDGTTTAFTMSVAPAGVSNVLVAVSGVLQDPSTYGVVGTTINFSTAPPSGTGNISCRYLGVPVTGVTTTAYRTVTEFTATASQTTFTPPSYTVGFINVYRNGVLLGSADYTASNGTTVVLATGATAGDLVTVESFQVSSVVNAIQNTAGSVSGTNIATGAVTPAKLSTGGPYWDTSGNVLVNSTSAANITSGSSSGGGFNSSGQLITSRATTSSSVHHTFYNTNGAVGTIQTNGSATNYYTTSSDTTGAVLVNSGIQFPATQVASANANTLDDYEEGTFTPSITASSGSITSYASRTGYYVRVGSLVMVVVEMVLSNKGSIGSAIRIADLPFTTSLNGFQGTGLAQANWSGLSGTLTGGLYGNAIYLYNQASTNQTNLSGTNLTNTSEFGLSLTYRIV